jgi:hypothetical protein
LSVDAVQLSEMLVVVFDGEESVGAVGACASARVVTDRVFD